MLKKQKDFPQPSSDVSVVSEQEKIDTNNIEKAKK